MIHNDYLIDLRNRLRNTNNTILRLIERILEKETQVTEIPREIQRIL